MSRSGADSPDSTKGSVETVSTEISADPDAAPRKGEVAFRLLELETEASRTGMLTMAMGGPGVTLGSYWGGAYSPVPGTPGVAHTGVPGGSGIRGGFK